MPANVILQPFMRTNNKDCISLNHAFGNALAVCVRGHIKTSLEYLFWKYCNKQVFG